MEEMDPVVDQENEEELIKPELKPDSPRWYEGHISLEDAKTFIKANITTAARSFIAIGFYLKCVRDRELFREEEYPDVWEFAKSEYGISKSTASRYMSMNDRFSENGNSPNVREEYRAYGKSQLQEMLYLEDDQLEQVNPRDRVEDIRNLRKPKEVPYIELPGQLDFEIDFPEILPQEQLVPPMISQKQTFEMDVEDLLADVGQEGIAISQQEPGEEKLNPIQRGCITGMNPYGTCSCCGNEGAAECCGECEESCNVRCGWFEETQEQQARPDQEQQEEKQGSGKFNTTPTSCPHREEFSCTVLDENRSIPGDGYNCGFSCCWACEFQGMCNYECNASSGRDGEIPEYNAMWFVKQWAENPVCSDDLRKTLKSCQDNTTNTDRAKAVQECLSPYGAYGRHFGQYSFQFHGFAGGMDFRIGKVDIHLKYGRFVQELMNLYPDFEKPVSKEPETVIEEEESVPEQPESVPESSESVIDGEYVEIPPEPEISARSILEEEQKELQDWIHAFEADGVEVWPPFIGRQKIIVAALAAMVAELEKPGPEPEKQEQPELPILKNNDQRKDFIDSYTSWPIWIDQKETGEKYYRYNLTDKIAMVVKVSWKHSWGNFKESKDYEYGAEQYYLLGVKSEWSTNKNIYVEDDTRTFYECSSNMTALVEYLKDFQKKGRGE